MKATAQIFLSYAREDEEAVENLYLRLSKTGFKPWMDKKDILPGERWEASIRRAIRNSDFFLACLSANSLDKRGFLQREIKQALDIWQEMLDSDIYLIPVRLEDCEVPESLRDFQWVNLFEQDGWTRLVTAIQAGMERRAEAEPVVQESIECRRIDATAPSYARVGQCIDLIVQVRFPDSPLLGIEDWPPKRKPSSIEQVYEPVALEFPADPQTGKLGSARLVIRVVAPNFKIESAAQELVEVPPDDYSKPVLFLLTAMTAGTCRINVEVRSADGAHLGTIPVETTVGEMAAVQTPIVVSLTLVVRIGMESLTEAQPTAQESTPSESLLAHEKSSSGMDEAILGKGPERVSDFEYDVFISYSHRDSGWVRHTLLPRLERTGLRVCIDYRDFEVGAPTMTEMERAVLQSNKTLLVLTPTYLDSEYAEFENLLVQTLDPAARQRRLLPLLLKACDLPPRLSMLTYLDFTVPDSWDIQSQRLLTTIKPLPNAERTSQRRTEDLWNKLGLLRNPFSAFDADDEPVFLLDSYLQPPYFREMWNSELRMCLLVGENGTGKTTVRKWIEAECRAVGSRLAVPYSVTDLTDVVTASRIEAGELDVKRLQARHRDTILRLAVMALFKRLQSRPGLIGELPEEHVDELKWFAKNYAPELLSEGQVNERLKKKGVDLRRVSARRLKKAQQSGKLDTVIEKVKFQEEESNKALGFEVALMGADDTRVTKDDASLPVLLEHFCRLAGFLKIGSVHILVDSLDKVVGIEAGVGKQVALIDPLLTDVYLMGVQGIQFQFFVTPELEAAIYSIPKINKDRLHVNRIWRWPEEKLLDLLNERIRAYKVSQESPVDDLNQLLSNLGLGGWQTRLVDMLEEKTHTPRDLLRLASCIVSERLEADLSLPEDPKSNFRERVLQRFETLGGIPSHALQLEPHRGGAIIDFVQRWVRVMKESGYGQDLDKSEVLPLAQEYMELTGTLLDYYCDPQREHRSGLILGLTNGAFPEAEEFLNQEYDTVFLVVVDALSLVDWMVIRDSVRSDLMEHSTASLRAEGLRLAVIPTLTPVATSCLYSGYLPAKLGVFGWKYVNADRRQTDLMIPKEGTGRGSKKDLRENVTAIKEDFHNLDTGRAFTLIAKGSWSTRRDAHLTGLYGKLCSGIQFARMQKQRPDRVVEEAKSVLAEAEFATPIVVLYLDNFDRLAHFNMELKGSEQGYYDTEQQVLRDFIIEPLSRRAKSRQQKYCVLLTGDHGKFTRYEREVIREKMGEFGWNSSTKATLIERLASRAAPVVGAVEHDHTAKTYIHWMRCEDEPQIRKVLQDIFEDKEDVLFYVGQKEVSRILIGDPRADILMPNVVVISKYNFIGDQWSSHGGVSLSEMLVPLVRFDINGAL